MGRQTGISNPPVSGLQEKGFVTARESPNRGGSDVRVDHGAQGAGPPAKM